MKTTLSNAVLFQAIAAVRSKNSPAHNITHFVVMNNSANAPLAIGASPIIPFSKP